jgi:hypothetical protein
MFLRFEENPNIGFTDDRVFQERSDSRIVNAVLRRRGGGEVWCAVTAMNEKGEFIPAAARKVDDSGEGTCWLVYGGAWGLRFREPACTHPWSLEDETHQWGEPFLLLPADGADLR